LILVLDAARSVVLIRAIKTVRGTYRPNMTERISSMMVALICILLPLMSYVANPKLFSPRTSNLGEFAVLASFLLLAFVAGVLLVNKLTQELELDGSYMTCRRIDGGVLWREPLSALTRARLVSGRQDWLILEFGPLRRRVAPTDALVEDLRRAA
jgi:hypothetical protein